MTDEEELEWWRCSFATRIEPESREWVEVGRDTYGYRLKITPLKREDDDG